LIANTEAEAGTDFKMEVTADLTNAQGGGLTLGDSYEILLYFDEDQIEITASKVPWEEGGNILVPIHPIPDVS
jgi:predicted enzyme related to lactoylglutathione lyase